MKKQILAILLILFFVIFGIVTIWSKNAYEAKEVYVELVVAKCDIENAHIFGLMVLPKEAVHQDPTGHYVYKVERVAGAWGNEYITTREKVSIYSESDEQITLCGYSNLYPVVLYAEGAIQNGTRVCFFR